MDFQSFVAVDRGVIAVGIVINGHLFLGFRGTKFIYDWTINCRTSLAKNQSRAGRIHRGFAEEAVRISSKIIDEMEKLWITDGRTQPDHILLAGHSLGGAVAALSAPFFPHYNTSICMFGAPRYCDVAAYYWSGLSRFKAEFLPDQIQRPGDIVPLVPPRGLGYADYPCQFDTRGNQIVAELSHATWPYFWWLALLFFGKRFEPHSMESYRRELGEIAEIDSPNKPLAPFEKLIRSDIT